MTWSPASSSKQLNKKNKTWNNHKKKLEEISVEAGLTLSVTKAVEKEVSLNSAWCITIQWYHHNENYHTNILLTGDKSLRMNPNKK